MFDFVAEAANVLPLQSPVIEIGARPAAGQEGWLDPRTLFPNTPYIGCDVQAGARVDQLEDVHDLTFKDESIGTVLALDTLEHVRDPIRAVEEMERVLRPGGVLLMSSVMFFPIHAHPWDYWRFTPEGFAQLLTPFPRSLVMTLGYELMPETVFGVGIKDSEAVITEQMFPQVSNRAKEWGRDARVDLGPIRLSTRQTWSIALSATIDAVKDRARRRRGRVSRSSSAPG